MKTKKPFGRPSKYNPKYCQEIEEFFRYIIASGNYPTFEGFAAKICVSTDTLQEWKSKHEDFSVSYNKVLNLQKENLFMKTLRKEYDSGFAKFLACACYGMSDRTQVDNISSDKSMSPSEIKVTIVK